MHRIVRLLPIVVLALAVVIWAPSSPAIAEQGAGQNGIPQSLITAYEVLGSYPHDTTAFIEGLVWYDGGFYESDGLIGESTLRRLAFPSGDVLKQVPLGDEYFAEGLTLVDNRLVQLTWRNQRGFVYDRDSFTPLGQFTYDNEGWGLTYDGTSLIQSDGSDTLTFRDPISFGATRTLKVTVDGKPIDQLNELEWIRGEIWANVWQTDLILRIDPNSGAAIGVLDMTGIYPIEKRTDRDDVLNGIAYDAATDRIFVSGKRWSQLFEIRTQ